MYYIIIDNESKSTTNALAASESIAFINQILQNSSSSSENNDSAQSFEVRNLSTFMIFFPYFKLRIYYYNDNLTIDFIL